MFRANPFAVAAYAVLAALRGSGVEVRFEQQQAPPAPTFRKRRVEVMRVSRRGQQFSPNGGKERKAAIRAARLRKFGTKKFGRYR